MKYIINQIDISDSFFFLALLIFILAKILFLFFLGMKYKKTVKAKSLLFFGIPIVAYTLGELSWIMFLFDNGLITKIILRIAWHLQPLQFYAQVLFLRSIIMQKYELKKFEQFFFYFFLLFSFFPLVTLLITDTDRGLSLNLLSELLFFVGIIKRLCIKLFGLAFLVINMIFVWRKIRYSKTIPNILYLQLRSFFVLLSSSLIFEFMLFLGGISPFVNSFYFFHDNKLLTLLYSVNFTCLLFFVARRIYNLRFLNLTDRVVGPTSRLTDAKLLEIKQALCKAETLFEFPFIHIRFFDELLRIDPSRVLFFLRHEKDNATNLKVDIQRAFEIFINQKPSATERFLIEDSILVYDELAFTNFYKQSEEIADILLFMETLNAAIIIPLRQKDRFFGALIVTKDTQEKRELFGHDMQTQMQLYGSFVTYAIGRLEQASYSALVEKHTVVLAELHQSQEKNARFYEAVTPLLKQGSKQNTGILLYKNSLFVILNPIAEELLQIDPNKHQGHPFAKVLKDLVCRILQYNNPQTIVEKNGAGQDIYCEGFFVKTGEVVILLSFATIANTISIEQTLLNPVDIDYLLFLRGTASGAIIDRMLPSQGAIVQKAKIHLLKTFLSKQAIFLNVENDDVEMILSALQAVCNKKAIHTIDAIIDTDYDAVTTLLFGKQESYGREFFIEHGFLYAFDESGIIHIANAHLLSMKTQKLLLNFLKTGSFYLYKSAKQYKSNAMIVLSASIDLHAFVTEGKFCKELYDYLKDSCVTLPNLVTLPLSELELLINGFAKQQMISAEYYHLFELTKNDLEYLNVNRPVSYHILQKMIECLIKKKIQKAQLFAKSDLIVQKDDEIIVQAVRLGKQALKDRTLMAALWDKLQNQSKIAQILNVERSSVYRRLKAYRIGDALSTELH